MRNAVWHYITSIESVERVIESSWDEIKQLSEKGVISLETQVLFSGLTNFFPFQLTSANFFCEVNGFVQGFYSEDELHQAVSEGRISHKTKVWGWNLPDNGIIYEALQFMDLNFIPDVKNFISLRQNNSTTILSGPNNSGKTLLLKLLRKELGPKSIYLAE